MELLSAMFSKQLAGELTTSRKLDEGLSTYNLIKDAVMKDQAPMI
jgi:hypothetical protein